MGIRIVLNSINKIVVNFITFLSLGILFFSLPFIIDKGLPKDPIILISIFIPIMGIFWIILLHKTDIKNKSNFFFISALINVLLTIAFILLIILAIISYNFYESFFTEYLDASSPLIQNLPLIVIIPFFISWVIFLIGYFCNK